MIQSLIYDSWPSSVHFHHLINFLRNCHHHSLPNFFILTFKSYLCLDFFTVCLMYLLLFILIPFYLLSFICFTLFFLVIISLYYFLPYQIIFQRENMLFYGFSVIKNLLYHLTLKMMFLLTATVINFVVRYTLFLKHIKKRSQPWFYHMLIQSFCRSAVHLVNRVIMRWNPQLSGLYCI